MFKLRELICANAYLYVEQLWKDISEIGNCCAFGEERDIWSVR